MNSAIGSDSAIVAGNPAKEIRRRFDEETVNLLLELQWRHRSIEKINGLIPILTCSDMEQVKTEIIAMLEQQE